MIQEEFPNRKMSPRLLSTAKSSSTVPTIAASGSATTHQGTANAECRIKPGDQIADRRASAQRRAIGFTGHTHEAAHCLRDEIERGTVAVGPALAEAGDVAAHQARIESFEPGLVEPDALKNSGSENLDQDIAAGD